jgi:integrase
MSQTVWKPGTIWRYGCPVPKRVHASPGIARMSNGKWRARYRAIDGRERSKVFSTKVTAERWRTTQLAAREQGNWIDPRGARITVGDLAPGWLNAKGHTRLSTQADYRELWESRLKPRWESTPVSAITVLAVEDWIAELVAAHQSPNRIRKLVMCLRQIVDRAVKDRKLAANPVTKDVALPRLPEPEPKPLGRDEFAELSERLPDEYAILAQGLVFTGMRIGEASALRVSQVVLDRRSPHILVERSLVVLPKASGGVIEGPTKGGRTRKVPLTSAGVDLFRAAIEGKSGSSLVFTNTAGGQVRARAFRAALQRASDSAGLRPVSPHDLRDTYASWAISSGANIKMLQEALGHQSATLTLDTYAKLLPDDMDRLRDGLDRAEREWAMRRDEHERTPTNA